MEVKASESTAKRSLTTGHLLITMPKFDPNEKAYLISKKGKEYVGDCSSNSSKNTTNTTCRRSGTSSHNGRGLQEVLLQEAKKNLSVSPVEYRNIVTNNHTSSVGGNDGVHHRLDLVESSSRRKNNGNTTNLTIANLVSVDDEDPPQMF